VSQRCTDIEHTFLVVERHLAPPEGEYCDRPAATTAIPPAGEKPSSAHEAGESGCSRRLLRLRGDPNAALQHNRYEIEPLTPRWAARLGRNWKLDQSHPSAPCAAASSLSRRRDSSSN